MPVDITCSSFHGALKKLNGNWQMKSPRRASIKRAAVTVGYKSPYEAKKIAGQKRADALRGIIDASLDKSLVTTQYYENLEETERAFYNFILASAFTKLFAEDYLKIPHLLHLKGSPNYQWSPGHASITKKIGSMPIGNKRPDFIGIRPSVSGRYTVHIVESKGRHNKIDTRSVSSALMQVSAVSQVVQYGLSRPRRFKPRLRVACLFAFSQLGVSGKIIDPPEDEKGLELQFNLSDYLSESYGWFFGENKLPLSRDLGSQYSNFIMHAIDDAVFLGLYKPVYDLVEKLIKAPARDSNLEDWIKLATVLKKFRIERPINESNEISMGLDGVLYVEK